MHCSPPPLAVTSFPSELGWFAILWCGPEVASLSFGHQDDRSARSALGELACTAAEDRCRDQRLVARLKAYAAGEPVEFGDVLVSLRELTPFQRRVAEECRKVPYGDTTSYAALATAAGSPKAARAVGQCMAANRVPLVVPCHRVLGANGRLGGFSAPGGVELKSRLLRLEVSAAPMAIT